MSRYRAIDVRLWDDVWFRSLPAEGRLLWLWAVTNHRTTPAGVIEADVATMSWETGLGRDLIEATLPSLSPKVEWWPGDHRLWVRRFYAYQCARSNRSNFERAAISSLEREPDDVRKAVVAEYPSLDVGGGGVAPPPDDPPPPTTEPAQEPGSGADAQPPTDLGQLASRVGQAPSAPRRERPNDIMAALVDRLHGLDASWRALTWPVVQKLINSYGASTVTEVLQAAWETRLIPQTAPMPLLRAMCERRANERGET